MDMKKLESVLEESGIVFLTYGGFITQSLIVGMTEALERESKEAELSMKQANSIFTIFIELAQNMMNYSRTLKEGSDGFDPKGMIVVGKNDQDHYYVLSRNIVNLSDREKMEPKLKAILDTDAEGVKKLYKEARRSGRNTHAKGGGIGFYEIAKRCQSIEYEFYPLSDNKFYFIFKALL